MHRTADRVGRRAILDVVVTVLSALGVGILLVQVGGASPLGSVAAVISGLTLVAVGVLNIVRRRPLFSTPADRVTLSRAVLGGGCATVVVLALLGVVPPRSWWLFLLAAPAVLLDAVDGAVARRTGTASEPGSRLDMETDAALLVVFSVPLAMVLGPWVLAVGLMRYVFVAASRFRPPLRAPLDYSRFRRIVAAVQSVVMVVALVPVVPVPVATVVVALALLLLTVSFARDVVTLERRSRSH